MRKPGMLGWFQQDRVGPKTCGAKSRITMLHRIIFVVSLACAALLGTACGTSGKSDAGDSGGSGQVDGLAGDGSGGDVDGGGTGDSGNLCKIDADCPALTPCTKGVCNPDGSCSVKQADEDDPCSDSDSCTIGDVCKQGKCKGTALSCDDKNPCTDDFCDPSKKDACVHAPVAKPCGQGDLCTSFACVAGACVAKPTAPCDDGNPCTADTCDAKLGCVYKAVPNAPCDDKNVCTDNDICKFGKCVGSTKTCSDNNPCTEDSCSADGSCAHVATATKPCNDGDLCTAKDACLDGTCKGTPLSCDDGDACTADKCNPKTGLCAGDPLPEGTACGESQVCTGGKCQ